MPYLRGSSLALAAALVVGLAASACEAAETFADIIEKTKPILDVRLRYENVDQAPLARNANAVTFRARAGFETGKVADTTLLAEGEWVAPLSSDYNNSFNGKTAFPVVADPRSLELNRLQLTHTGLPKTTITLGRQRINLDDQRFVGNVGWRQNEQTFDALRIVNTGIPGVTLDATYLNRVNRVFGPDSRQGRYKGDTMLLNLAYATPVGKLTGFGYLMEFEPIAGFAPERDSSHTFGARVSGTRDAAGVKWAYTASYATQKNYENNPLRYSADYWLLEASGAYKQVNAGVGYEVLGGTGAKGFTTPLATLHRFQGWADKFLTTPPDGIRDLYFTMGAAQNNVGPFSALSASVVYHRFDAERISLHYGDEVNAQLQARLGRTTFTLKYGDYNADRMATDTRKIWLQVEFAL